MRGVPFSTAPSSVLALQPHLLITAYNPRALLAAGYTQGEPSTDMNPLRALLAAGYTHGEPPTDMNLLKYSLHNHTELWARDTLSQDLYNFKVVRKSDKKEWQMMTEGEAMAVYCSMTRISPPNGCKKAPEAPDTQILSLVLHLWQQSIAALDMFDLSKCSVDQVIRLASMYEDLIPLLKHGGELSDGDRMLTEAIALELSKVSDLDHDTFTLPQVFKMLDYLQLLKSMLPLVQCKHDPYNLYQALACDVTPHKNKEYLARISTELCSEGAEDVRIFDVKHPTSILQNLCYKGGQSEPLYHATAKPNLISVLASGLLVPWQVAEERGLAMRDHGRLGRGIYFSRCPVDSLEYLEAEDEEGQGCERGTL